MKIEYETEEDRGECVAYVDSYGNLILRDEDDDGFVIFQNGKPPAIMGDFDPDGAVHKFYRGDKITITF